MTGIVDDGALEQIRSAISSRDYFAGCAMMALVNHYTSMSAKDEKIARNLATRAFELADAMMAAREGGS